MISIEQAKQMAKRLRTALQAQNRWAELDGQQHTHYCGAYWANGFHEDGVVSALRVAAAFGETL